MARRYELIVFDWDGTLLDSAGVIVDAIQAACRDLDIPVPTEARARHVIGLGLSDAMRHAVPELAAEDYGRMVERYRHHYLSRDHELRLFHGVEAMLDQLAAAGFLLAIATGKSRPGLDRALHTSGLGPRFVASRCADECFSKPHPQMLEELMDELAVAPQRTIMIGDTTHDLLMAQNAGVDSIGVAYGAHPRAALEALTPRTIAGGIADLHAWLMNNA